MSSNFLEASEEASISLTGSTGNRAGITGNAGQSVSEDALEHKIISKKEQQTVSNARRFVFVVFICCAAAVSVAVYFFTANSDQRDFETEYYGFVSDIMSLTQWEIQNNFALMAQLAATVTNAATLSNSTFPFLVDPNFEVIGGYVDGMSGIISTGFAPFVQSEQKTQWENFAVSNQWWVERGARLRKIHPYHKDPLDGSFQDHEERRKLQAAATVPKEAMPIPESIFKLNDQGWPVVLDVQPGQVTAPMWQISPTPGDDPSLVNYDLLSDPQVNTLFRAMNQLNDTVISDATEIDFLFNHIFDDHEKQFKVLPHSFIMEPVYVSFEPDAEMVGVLLGVTAWENLFNNIVPEGVSGIHCLVKDTCGNTFTFELVGPKPVFLGIEDFHDTNFDKYERSGKLEKYEIEPDELCVHELVVYPSQKFRDSYDTHQPLIYTTVVVLSFLFTGLMFLIYDYLVHRRQARTMQNALRTNALVASLFPANVRDRIMDQQNSLGNESRRSNGSIKGFLNDNKAKDTMMDDDDEDFFATKPIADLFPYTTVMFADIAGFTAWSSTREPAQVFILLETVYRAFDIIAKMRRVFKVETVGDCYVAVCGLPDPRKDHAVVMARFARDCLVKMNKLTKKLESRLGPDTGDLKLRVGLHSGAVTAGVLRGENARFQLFGDTMNTASRIESTGTPNRIHCSTETADLLAAEGKAQWAIPRKDKVTAKGKGELTTFWIDMKGESGKASSVSSGSSQACEESGTMGLKEPQAPQSVEQSDKTKRLVKWNVELLANLLRSVVARRKETKALVQDKLILSMMEDQVKTSGQVIEEVAETIYLPTFRASKNAEPKVVQLSPTVTAQLTDFITELANMYHDNAFHSWEHASHVTMSVSKLLTRIVAPSEQDLKDQTTNEAMLHDHTYGITSDPLTQFSCVLSALIHDIDHSGVPNSQLVKEGAGVAATYHNQSVAEQNSVDLAWKLLMNNKYADLRHTIYGNTEEFKRFRQLVINCVMSTDIMDSSMKALRNDRWEKAFSENANEELYSKEHTKNRKATVVIEHLIQASDVSHTMQHWHIFRKWNERLFKEMYKAYREGRAEKDPSDFWYKGEIGFFDFYIIPLAKKLKECGVFGVSSDEYLSYAQANRNEWEARGEDVVAAMVKEVKAEYPDGPTAAASNHSTYQQQTISEPIKTTATQQKLSVLPSLTNKQSTIRSTAA